jgi:hypothetical protein
VAGRAGGADEAEGVDAVKIEAEPKWWGRILRKYFGNPQAGEIHTHRWKMPLQHGEELPPLDPWEWEEFEREKEGEK